LSAPGGPRSHTLCPGEHVWSVHSAALYRECAHASRHFCDFGGENSLATETARARPAAARTRLANLLTAAATPRTHPDVSRTRPANPQCSVLNPRPRPATPDAQIPAPQSGAGSRDTQVAVAREFSRPRSHQPRDGIAHSPAGIAPSRAERADSRAGVVDWRGGSAASRAETAEWRAGVVDWRARCVEPPQAPCAPGAEIRRGVLCATTFRRPSRSGRLQRRDGRDRSDPALNGRISTPQRG
jgi:hypothetical protein